MQPPLIARHPSLCALNARCLLLVCVVLGFGAGRSQAVDLLVENAVRAISQLTDPQRLTRLPEESFPAQLGPALGWLHVARRQDVAPESVIARAFARNGLTGERARLTREALLRNLARADAWELFTNEVSAHALAIGQPAPIQSGMHRGHLAQTAVVLPDGLGPEYRREFACLVLRADDELPPAPAPSRRRPAVYRYAAQSAAPTPGGTRRRPASHVSSPTTLSAPTIPVSYDEPLPAE